MANPIPNTRFHRFKNRGEIATWENNLNRKWPFRQELVQHIVEELKTVCHLGKKLQVVEFASGPGMVAWQLLNQLPDLKYTGLDFSGPFIDFARQRTHRFGGRARFVLVDLLQDNWQAELPQPVDAFISLQALHDLGSEEHVAKVYTEGFKLLSNCGKFVNADFVVPPNLPNDKDPGRLSVARHLDLLRKTGYKWVDLRVRHKDFACMVAGKS